MAHLQLVGVLETTPKGWRFEFWSGRIIVLVSSLVLMWETADGCFFSLFLKKVNVVLFSFLRLIFRGKKREKHRCAIASHVPLTAGGGGGA